MRKWKNHVYLMALTLSLVAIIILWYSDVINRHDLYNFYGMRSFTFHGQKENSWLLDMDIVANPEKYPFRTNFTILGKGNESNRRSYESIDFWTTVKEKIYIYSAYQDKTRKINGTVIKIVGIGLARSLNGLRLQCLFKYKSSKLLSNNVYSASRILQENHGAQFSPMFFYCFSRNTDVPSQVALRETKSNRTSKWLAVHNAKNRTDLCDVAVCVRPLYGPFRNLQLLAEFLGFYSSQGVTSFTFYEQNVTEEVRSYLTRLRNGEFKVALLNWKLPRILITSSWQYGQVASVQDCILRNSPTAKFVLLVDLDEFLVPRKHFTLIELMNELSSRTKYKVGSFIFRQSYFCDGKSSLKKNEFPLLTSSWTFREDKIWTAKERSKLIVRPEAVLEGGIHFVWKHTLGWTEAVVPWELAMIHHYNQQWCQENRNKSLIEDNTAESFKYEIIYSRPMDEWRRTQKP